MTTDRAVAESFSKGFGLILTLTMYDHDLRCFDCSWLSNYPTEEEKLFIGGYEAIRLNSIILKRLNHNYKHYVTAIGIIQNMFDARHNPQKDGKMDGKTRNAVIHLLNTKRADWDEEHRYDNVDEEDNIDNFMVDDDEVIGPYREIHRESAMSVNRNVNRHSGHGQLGSLPALADTTSLKVVQPSQHLLHHGNDRMNDGLLPIPLFDKKQSKHRKTITDVPNQLLFDISSRPVPGNIIPVYVEQLFEYFCKKWDRKIIIDMLKWTSRTQYDFFKTVIIDIYDQAARSESSYPVKIDVICKIFENVKCIEIVNGFRFTKHTIQCLYELLHRDKIKNGNVFKNLNAIYIENSNNMLDRQVQFIVKERRGHFDNIGWQMDYGYLDASINTATRDVINAKKYAVFIKEDERNSTIQ